MKIHRQFLVLTVSVTTLLGGGCATTNPETRVTNPQQPGATVGHAVGTAVGTVGSNVVGAMVGGAEGATQSSLSNERRIIRTWRTETTADGRTIQVPVEIEVDANGRPIKPQPQQAAMN